MDQISFVNQRCRVMAVCVCDDWMMGHIDGIYSEENTDGLFYGFVWDQGPKIFIEVEQINAIELLGPQESLKKVVNLKIVN